MPLQSQKLIPSMRPYFQTLFVAGNEGVVFYLRCIESASCSISRRIISLECRVSTGFHDRRSPPTITIHNHPSSNHSQITPTTSHSPTTHTQNDNLSRLQTPLPRIQTPHPRPTRWHHRRPRHRRRPLHLGSADRRTRGHSLRRRHLPRRVEVSKGLSLDAADHEVLDGSLASEW